jgi:hypothetical protein
VNFGEALPALKDGRRLRRSAWAIGCWMVLVPGSTFTVEADRPLGKAAPHLVGDQANYWPHVDMCVFQAGVPSLGPKVWADDDILADDWELMP